MRYAIVLLTLLLALGFHGFASSQTGNEEAICSQPYVITCITFEDYPLGSIQWGVTRYKDKGWGVSTGAAQGVVVGDDGKKWIRMVTPANRVSGGYMDQSLPSGQRTVYFRWVVKYSPNSIWSPIATKHNEMMTDGQLDNGIFNFVNNRGIKTPVITYILNAKCAAADCWFGPNTGGGFSGFVPGQTYTVEARVTMNTCASCNDGYVQGWIDDVLKYDHPNVNLKNTNNPTTTGIFLASYWNCDANEDCSASQYNHPEMYRYMRNVVVATQRIGLVGGTGVGGVTPPPPPGVPSDPGSPQLGPAVPGATSVMFPMTFAPSVDPSGKPVTYIYTGAYNDGTAAFVGQSTPPAFPLTMPYHASGTAQDAWGCVQAVGPAPQLLKSVGSSCLAYTVPAKTGTVPPTNPPPPGVSSTVNSCTLTLTVKAPDATAGWQARFKIDAGVTFGTVATTTDATGSYARVKTTIAPGPHSYYVEWLKAGVLQVTSQKADKVCP